MGLTYHLLISYYSGGDEQSEDIITLEAIGTFKSF